MSAESFALITGTSSGLGEAIKNEFIRQGIQVLGVARRSLAEEPGYQHLQLDLSLPHAIQKIEAALPEHSPKEWIVVNNAATLEPMGLWGSLDPEKLAQAIHLNTTVALQIMNLMVRCYPKAKKVLVNVSSGAAHKAYQGWGLYCGSKAALKMAGEVLAAEEHPHLKIIEFEPGVLDTPMQSVIRDQKREDFPMVARFQKLHDEGQLIKARQPAEALYQWIRDPSAPPYQVRRFQG